jgi:hypothetical protein
VEDLAAVQQLGQAAVVGVGPGVVGEDALGDDPMLEEPVERAPGEDGDGGGALVVEHLGVERHVPSEVTARASQAQVRLHHRHRTLIGHGKRSTVANVAVARELCGFLWAAMTHQPLREDLAA